MIYSLLIAPFYEYEFMRRALAGVIAIAVPSGPVGVFLMLRRMSLTGDVMAHAILPGTAVGFLLCGLDVVAMTAGGVVAGLMVALFSGVVARVTLLREDAAMAAFYLLSLALGVVLVSAKGSNVDLLHILFGHILALDDPALLLLAAISSFVLLMLAVIWRPLVMECVDPGFLGMVSRSGAVAHLSFLFLIVLMLVAGFHALGTLLSVAMMMLPAAVARFWTRQLTAMVMVAVMAGLASGVAGLLLSYHTELPSGPAIVLVAGGLYLCSLMLGPVGGLLPRLLPRRHLEA